MKSVFFSLFFIYVLSACNKTSDSPVSNSKIDPEHTNAETALSPGQKAIEVNDQKFIVEEKTQTVNYKNRNWLVYNLSLPQKMITKAGNLLIRQFWFADNLNDDEQSKYGPAFYILSEEAKLVFADHAAGSIEATFKKDTPLSYSKSINFFQGQVEMPVRVPVVDGVPAQLTEEVALSNPIEGILESDYPLHYRNGSDLIFKKGKMLSIKDGRIMSGYVKEGVWYFSDGSWANLQGDVSFGSAFDYGNGNLEKFTLIEGFLTSLDHVTRFWKSVKKFSYNTADNSLLVLEGTLSSPEKVMVPQLDVMLPATRIKFSSSAGGGIKFLSLASPYETNLCVDFSSPSRRPNKKCYKFSFYNYLDFFGSFDFETVIKYNKEILWNIKENGSGIPWAQAEGGNVAAKLGYCRVVMQRWTSFLGKYEAANISGYGGYGTASENCSNNPDSLVR